MEKVIKVHRDKFPKVIEYEKDGERLYRIDCRKKGRGSRLKKTSLSAALKEASAIGKDDSIGVLTPAERDTSARNIARLASWGKSLDDAVNHYIAFLEKEKVRSESATIESLTQKWIAFVEKGERSKRREPTLKELRQIKNLLNRSFPGMRIGEITEKMIKSVIDPMEVSLRRKYNIRKKFSQFWKFCKDERLYSGENPCEHIVYDVASDEDSEDETGEEITILAVDEVKKLMEIVETEEPSMKANFALRIFAGIREGECQKVTWNMIDLHPEVKQIKLPKGITKNKKPRSITMDGNLFEWLSSCPNREGFVTPQKGAYRAAFDRARQAAGYAVNGFEGKEVAR